MKKYTFKGIVSTLVLSLFLANYTVSQSYSEGFTDINTLAGSGWTMTNASTPIGISNWFQGNNVGNGGPFDAYNGAANSYIGANFNNTAGAGTISNWLITPLRTYKNGDVLTFYTRKTNDPLDYPDRLEVRLSANGASGNVGTGAAVGDFTTLLLSINPTLVAGGYPVNWTLYTITISGLSAPTSGRIAFRYFVTSGGPSGANSDYIGIDQVDYTPYVCPPFVLTTGGALPNGTAGAAYSNSITQTGALGTPTFSIASGSLPTGTSLSTSGTISGTPSATGTFNFDVTVTDNSGCSGTESYSITIDCPANPTSLSGLPNLCTNDAPVTLNQGLPAGGTYSGTGVSGGTFDPNAGTQIITYVYTDPFGCAHSTTGTITVNTQPTVTLASFSAACSNDGSVTLLGGSPAGGVYSGTNVSAGNFDPSGGDQAVTYTYTDANGCSSSDMQTFTVNSAPSVTLNMPVTTYCINSSASTLTGGSPANGTYSGNGVSSNMFNPSTAGAGNTNITYTFTDANGCTNSAVQAVMVDACAGVAENDLVNIILSPNPNKGAFSLEGIETGKIKELIVMDMNGKIVANKMEILSVSTLKISLDTQIAGMYILTIKVDDKSLSFKIMVE